MRIGVLYNCQRQGLAASLRRLIPGAEVLEYELSLAMLADDKTAIAASLAACDAVLAAGTGVEWGPLATAALRRTTRTMAQLPPLGFTGFHPDTVYVEARGGHLGGPTGPYHSRLAIAAYLGGLTPDEAAALYNRLVFSRLGYLHAFDRERALTIERYAQFKIDLTAAMARWVASGCFMHSVNHPKIAVLMDLATIACTMLRLEYDPARADCTGMADALSNHPAHPLFPDLAQPLGLVGDTRFQVGSAPGEPPHRMALEDFLVASFAIFAAAPRTALRDTDGVAAAMVACELAPPAAPVAVPTVPALQARAAMSSEALPLPVTAPRVQKISALARRRIAVAAHARHEGLVAALARLLPDCAILDAQTATAELLASCDATIVCRPPDAGARPDPPSFPGRVHYVPTVEFAGFHPDVIYATGAARQMRGPTGALHSRLALAGYLAGLAPEPTARLFNTAVFARLGYPDLFARECERLLERLTPVADQAAAWLARWRAGGCFMHNPRDPKPAVTLGLAYMACAKLGESAAEIDAGDLPDPLAGHPSHPVYPALAPCLGIAAELQYKPRQPPGRPPRYISIEPFMYASYKCFDTMPRDLLQAMDGVSLALEIVR